MLKWRVKEVALTRGMSMRQLARKAGVSYRTVREVCHNPFHGGRLSTWTKLATALEAPLSAVVEDTSLNEGHE
jgi:lambda repressor-like predicted transcriptional regulator